MQSQCVFVVTLIVLVVEFVCGVTNSTNSANSNSFTLDLYFTANLAGRFAAIDNFGHDCVPTDASSPSCFGGAPRFVAAIQQARQAYSSSSSSSSSTSSISRPILLDAGNSYFGSRFMQDLGVGPSATWMNAMQYDAMGLSFWDLVQGPAGLASYLRQLNTNIAVIASNANVTNEASLFAASSSTQSLILPYTVLSLATSSSSSTTVQVGVMGIIAETASQTATVGNIVIPTQLAASEIMVRQSVAQLRKKNPSVAAIVAVCSSNFCSDYLQNIPDISVMIVTTCSTSGGQPSSMSAPLTINDAFSRRVAVCMDSSAESLGHVAAALDLSSAPFVNVVSLVNSPTLLTNNTASDATMLQLWKQYSTQMANIEASNVIGYTDTAIYGAHVDCIQGQCPFGDFATDALLSTCSGCNVALGIGGSYLNSIPAGNISSAALHLVDAFSEAISFYSVRGSALLDTLYSAIAVPDNFIQMSGMRFAYNPNTSLPLSQRIIEVQIRDRVTGAWNLLSYTAVYSIVSVTYLRISNQWPSITTSSTSLSFQDNVATLYSVYAQYVRSKTPFRGFETSTTTLAPCLTNTFELVSNSSTAGAASAWPAPACRILQSSGHLDMSQVCPTNVDVCQQIITASVSGGGVEQLQGIAPFSSSQCSRCSGLGTCQAQICHCQQPTSGTFANQTMVLPGPNGDCSIIRRQITSTGSTLAVMSTFCSMIMVASLVVLGLFIRHRQSRIVRAASLPFLFLMVVGVWLACASAIVALLEPTDTTCMTQYWLLGLAFAVLFGSLFAKTYRLHRIFNAQKLRDVGMSVRSLAGMVVAFIIVVAAILAAWQALAPLSRTLLLIDPAFQYLFVCSSTTSVTVFLTALALFCGGLLLFGAHLAYELRNVDELYNETRYLAYAIYQTLFVAIVAVPLIFLFRNSATADIAMAIQSIATLFPAAFTLAVISIPKLRLILHRRDTRGGETGNHTVLSDENVMRSSAARANANVSLPNENNNPLGSVHMSTSPRQGFVDVGDSARPASKIREEPYFVFHRRRMQGELFTWTQTHKLSVLKREIGQVEAVLHELKELRSQVERGTTRSGNNVMVYVATSPHNPSLEQQENTLATTTTDNGTGSVGRVEVVRAGAGGPAVEGARREGQGRPPTNALSPQALSPQVVSPQSHSVNSPITYATPAS